MASNNRHLFVVVLALRLRGHFLLTANLRVWCLNLTCLWNSNAIVMPIISWKMMTVLSKHSTALRLLVIFVLSPLWHRDAAQSFMVKVKHWPYGVITWHSQMVRTVLIAHMVTWSTCPLSYLHLCFVNNVHSNKIQRDNKWKPDVLLVS